MNAISLPLILPKHTSKQAAVNRVSSPSHKPLEVITATRWGNNNLLCNLKTILQHSDVCMSEKVQRSNSRDPTVSSAPALFLQHSLKSDSRV